MLHILTAQTPKGDPYALLLVIVLVVVFTIWTLIRNAKQKKAANASVESVPAEIAAEQPKAPGSAGRLKLYNVEPKTAAMIMAIVAEKTGKPLNELRFISIKEVE